MNLSIPMDFERLPEFWQLCEVLKQSNEHCQANRGRPVSRGEIHDQALLSWLRLWVVLGYLARTTNRPGWLSKAGERQLAAALTQYGEEEPPVQALVASGLLRVVADGWQCDLFAGDNRHLSGTYLSREMRGNIRSALARAKNNIAAEAMMQANLLSPEVYRKRDGSKMSPREVDRSMVLIMTLDRCLKAPGRQQGTYTGGLLADACAVIEAVKPEDLTRFYNWLAENAGRAAIPDSAEAVLLDWNRIHAVSLMDAMN